MSSLQAQVNIEQPVEVPREPDVSSNMEVLRINNENGASKPPVATVGRNLLNSLFKFKPGEPLGKYIATKAEKKDVYTLTEVLSILKETIRRESMFDEFNPSIILCDPSLEEALGMKALHVTEIRDLVLKQLEKLSDPPLTNSFTSSTTPSLNNPHAQSQSHVLGRSISISSGIAASPAIRPSVSPPSSQPSLPPTTQRVPSPSSQPSVPPFPSQPSISAQATLTARQLSCTPRPNVISSNVYNNPSARFSLKPDFLPVIRSIPGVDPNQTLFSYEQVTLLLSKYILAKKHTMFDQRNIKVALVANDPLGKAFNVKAFHRCQVTNLLRSQLIHVEEPCNSAVSSTTGEPENVQVPPFPVLQKSQSMPAHVAHAVNQLAGASRLASTSAGVVRKRSLTPEAPDQVAKRSRDNGPTQYAVVVRKANDSDSETETICSAQGYETAAADRDETILVERVESTENGNDGGISTSDTEMEDDKSDHFSRTALVYSVQYEEYEVESSSEDEKRPNIAGGGADSDSENNSDIEDAYVVAAGAVAIKEAAGVGSDSDYLGDSEEEDVTPGEKELDVVDPELEERDNWRCAQCDTPNTPLIRYCGKCWKIRKGWMPDRPKPRKKVRPAWGSRVAKKNLHALDRSLSDPGQGQDEADSVLASEVVAVSDDEKNKDGVTDSQDSGISCAGSQELLSQDLEVGCSQDQYSESGSSGSNKRDDAMSVSSQDLGSEVSGEHGSKKEQNLCMFCNVRPKNASFIHGRLGHQVCCYQCAKKCWKKTGTCPICRRKIEKIVKNLIQ